MKFEIYFREFANYDTKLGICDLTKSQHWFLIRIVNIENFTTGVSQPSYITGWFTNCFSSQWSKFKKL